MDSNGFFGPEAVEFAGNGRYLIDVDGEGQKSYTRVTTLAKTLESTFHLAQWQQKNAAKGVAMRPDLVARAAITPVSNKEAWKEILEQAEVVSAGGEKRNLGSAFHELHDTVAGMTDEEYAAVPAELRDLYEKYRAELARLGIVELISEVTVCATAIGTAGKADGFVRMPDGSVRVLDRKSGRVVEYPHAPACQLATYANADRILIGGVWKSMAEVFPTLDKSWGLIVDVKFATADSPASVHVYEIDLSAGWYGALLATKVRRWRNRKDLLTPYQPEQMPTHAVIETAAPAEDPAKLAAAARTAVDPQIGVSAPMGHPAWSSVQQAVIQLNPDGTLKDPQPAQPGPDGQFRYDVAAPIVPEQPKYGFTSAQIEAGEHLRAAADAQLAADEALKASQTRQVSPAKTLTLDSSDADQLLLMYKDKAKLQAAARQLDPSMKVNRTRANLASDMTSHPQWATRRSDFLPSGGTSDPDPIPAVVSDAPPAPEPVPTAMANPFEQPPAPVDPPSALKAPEDLALEAIAAATNKAGLATVWDRCQEIGTPWSARLLQAAQVKMGSFTK